MTAVTFRRYTSLPSALHILRSRCLTLLDPKTWDDKNDTHFMEQYKLRIGAKSVLALCFAEHAETYHHWRVFTHGSDGVCIQFDKGALTAAFAEAGIKHEPVRYEEIDRLVKTDVAVERLPFLKRWPFQDEREYRAVYVTHEAEAVAYSVPIEIRWISRINVSPWLPAPLSDAVISTIRAIPGCERLKVYRSTLIENEKWKSVADRATPAPLTDN